MLAQALREVGARIEEAVRSAGVQASSWVSSWGSAELLVMGGAVLIGLLGYRLVLRRR